MQVGGVSSIDHRNPTVVKKQMSDTEPCSNAVTEAATEGEGMFLGLTMVPEEGQTTVYGMRAILLEESTFEKPIVQVISNLNGKKEVFDIDISQVNPQNATRMLGKEPEVHLAHSKRWRYMRRRQNRMVV